jgi:tyrosyl-tRNA synthetase
MQIGGADQYGNITAGLDAVKHIAKNHPNPVVRDEAAARGDPFGFTVPLLTTSSGAKFGKSAGNAVWLDNEQTSVFDLYGYFLRTSDADIGKYLRLFTFIPIEEIDKLVEQHMQDPSKRIAQHTLARELVEIVHGEKEAKLAEEQHRLMYGKKSPDNSDVMRANELESLSLESQEQASQYTTLNNRPHVNVQLPASVVHGLSIGRILYAAGLAISASEGHRLAQQKAVYIGGMNRKARGDREAMLDGQIAWTRVKTWVVEDTAKFLVHGDLLMLRRGKNMLKVIQVVPDEEYDASGKTYPGQKMPGAPPAQLDIRSKKVLENLRTQRGGGPYGKPHHGAWKELKEEDFFPNGLPPPEEEQR